MNEQEEKKIKMIMIMGTHELLNLTRESRLQEGNELDQCRNMIVRTFCQKLMTDIMGSLEEYKNMKNIERMTSEANKMFEELAVHELVKIVFASFKNQLYILAQFANFCKLTRIPPQIMALFYEDAKQIALFYEDAKQWDKTK